MSSWGSGEGELVYGPFLPRFEEEQQAAAACSGKLPLPPPPLLYPRGVCTAAWDKARLQLGLLLSRAAADVGASPSTAAAAVASFHAGLCCFTHLDAAALSACLTACLFLAGKAADEEFNLRSAVASLGFCKFHAQQQQHQQRLQQQPQYLPMGIREYWQQRQKCFFEEQRLVQGFSFALPSPTLWNEFPLLLLLLRPTHAEAAIAAALVADAAAGPLAAEEGDQLVAAAAACVVARKLLRRFRARIKAQQEEMQQRQWLYPPSSVAAAAIAPTPEHKTAATEAFKILEDELSSGAVAALEEGDESDTAAVLQRILPLLQSSGSCNTTSSSSKETPLCQQLASATKKLLLQYALLLDESKGHRLYAALAARGRSVDFLGYQFIFTCRKRPLCFSEFLSFFLLFLLTSRQISFFFCPTSFQL
ncbi:hypothetical protein Esti_004291 [Eimeria stiedai]